MKVELRHCLWCLLASMLISQAACNDSSEPHDVGTDSDSTTAPSADTDLAAGETCTGDGNCLTGHCNNNLCCAAGTCCTADNADQCGSYGCSVAQYVCNTACGTSPEDHAMCAAGYHCLAGDCVADGENGAPCRDGNDCAAGNCGHGVCCANGKACCTANDQCSAEAPLCGTAGHCVPCTEEDLCAAAFPQMPNCDAATGACVECATDAHCRLEQTPNYSPLGVCSLENICTCWVNGDPKWQCTSSDQCPAGFICTEDYKLGSAENKVCLRECYPPEGPQNGVACRYIAGAPDMVWALASSCYAGAQIGADCSTDATVCSVDGSGDVDDGYCGNGTCTISCYDPANEVGDDARCPAGYECGIQYCQPQP